MSNSMAKASRAIEIEVPPQAFFGVLRDYARYPEFLPEVKAVKLGAREGEAVEVTYWLDVKLKMYEFTLRHVGHPWKRIDWHLIRGGDFIRKNEGAWTLERTASGGTRATYAIEIAFGPLIPRTFEKVLAERGLPNLLANFKARAEKLQGVR
jgi:ribosome-associated toxin RatA of RatAB toxin-antitoxin module